MRKKIYPWIILSAVLAIGILYAPPDLYKYAPPGPRKKARTAMVELKLKLDRVRYGPSSNCTF